MTARSLAANLVDLGLAAAIAALPAHVLAVSWGSGPLPSNGFPDHFQAGPSLALRIILLLVATAGVWVLLRSRLARDGQGPGNCLFSLRVENGRLVEDRDGLDLVERLSVFAGRFARTLILALACVLVLALWGGTIERSASQAHQARLLRSAFIFEAEYGCCSGYVDRAGQCPRMLAVWAAVADRSDGKGDIPPRESLLDRCPAARTLSRP